MSQQYLLLVLNKSTFNITLYISHHRSILQLEKSKITKILNSEENQFGKSIECECSGNIFVLRNTVPFIGHKLSVDSPTANGKVG